MEISGERIYNGYGIFDSVFSMRGGKKMKKQLFAVIAAAFLAVFALCGCAGEGSKYEISLGNGDLTLNAESTYQIQASVSGVDEPKFIFNTSSTAIATVNSGGLITAKSRGEATITVRAETPEGEKAKSFQVTVVDERVKLTYGSNIQVTQNGTEIASGGCLQSAEELRIEITAPRGSVLQSLTVKQGGTEKETVKISDTVFAYLPVAAGGDIEISAVFAQDTRPAALNGTVLSAGFAAGDTFVPFYDGVDPADCEISVTDASGKAYSVQADAEGRFSLSLPQGTYTVRTVYHDNVNEQTVTLYANETREISAYVSDAYLGGYVTYAGSQHKSYNNADRTAQAGSNWELADGYRNQIKITNYTYAFQDEAVGTSYYLEGSFDTANAQNVSLTNTGGLLIAHGPDDLADSGGQKYKVFASVVDKWLVITFTGTGWDTSDSRTIANLSGRIDDASDVKLGVLRDGTDYFFFVNGEYIARYSYDVIENESGFGVANATTVQTIRAFNYTIDAEKLAQIKQAVPQSELQSRDIDVYLIAGQSNGSGYASFNANSVKSAEPDIYYGFDNILYAGNSRSTNWGNMSALQRRIPVSVARIGYGMDASHFGAEAGAAAVLSTYYNGESGKYAGFIKYAAGGTSLLNNLSGENASEGNWVSPSYEATLSNASAKTGGLYDNFLKEFSASLSEYESLGFTVHVKGLFWMQGEADIGQESEYKKAFSYFAEDIRRDLGELSGEDLSQMPIFVGEISETFNSYSSMAANKRFIAMQNELADLVENVHIVHSSSYQVNGPNGVLGTDQYHWNQDDMIAIGKLLGEAILSVCCS